MEREKIPSTVKGIMTHPVVTAETDSSVLKAAELMSKRKVGSLIATLQGKPVGIVTERDILERIVAKDLEPSKVQIAQIMSKPLITVRGDMSLVEAIRTMQKRRVRRLPVAEKEKLIGIVSQRDLIRALVYHVVISFRPLLEPGQEAPQ